MALEDMTLDTLCINTIRTLAMDAVQAANSGHPGAPMGGAAMAYTLWTRHLRFDPKDPTWSDRDRFILSNGHASMLLYALLHLYGFDLPLDEIKRFRQWGSRTPGHPENFITPGVEMTTGPLGQGFAHGVGFAIAEAQLAANYNRGDHRPVDHYTYAIVSDGDLMEGVANEAASLAGHLRLGKLIYLFDDNHITIDGTTDLAFTEDIAKRFEALGWHTLRVADGNDVDAIDQAIHAAKAETDRPSLLLIRTHIGFGSPNKQDSPKSHGSPLGVDEIRLTKAALGWPEDAHFLVPDAARDHMRGIGNQGSAAHDTWRNAFANYKNAHPELAAAFERRLSGTLPEGWDADLPSFTVGESLATRAASGKVLDALRATLPELIGGSADLSGSVKVPTTDGFTPAHRSGRTVFFGVREHAMAAACNGMALHGGVIPFAGTFLIFSDYMRPSVRLGALEHAKAIWIWTHDSIGLGEDGPTHQPIEQLASLRAIPGFTLLRPADAVETREAWRVAIQSKHPVGLVLTRQGLPVLEGSVAHATTGVAQGAYIVHEPDNTPQVILMSTGSEVHLAVNAAIALATQNIAARVVSMPSWDLFEAQSQAYRDEVLPPSITARVAIEAAATLGWHRYVGLDGEVIGLDHFGASGPYQTLYEEFGITTAHVVEAAQRLVGA